MENRLLYNTAFATVPAIINYSQLKIFIGYRFIEYFIVNMFYFNTSRNLLNNDITSIE